MIRALFAALWLASATFLVGYFGLALAQWVAQEWRVARFRRQVRRTDRRELRKRDAIRGVWS